MSDHQPLRHDGCESPDRGRSMLRDLRERFGAVEPPNVSENETLRLQLHHRSVRRFLPEQIDDGALDLILMAAQAASHSSNLQAWSVVVVRDEGRRRRISEAIGGMRFIQEASVLLVWVADLVRAERLLERQGQDMETVRYLEGALVPFVDIGIAAQSALLAAESLGLGGVFIGAVRNDPVSIVDELELPRLTFPVLGMALGVPDPDESAGVKPRLSPSAVVHRERYSTDFVSDGVEEYESRLAGYYENYGVRDYSWARRIADRLGPRAGLKGRHRLREWLMQQGFPGE